MKMFDPEGPLMTALGKFADIVLCNLMFCVLCLPIITAGASATALYACMLALVYEEDRNDGLIFRDFWRAFRGSFKKATLLWLVCLVGIGFLAAYYWVVQFMAGGYGRVYQTTFYLLALLFLFGFVYVFPLEARFENSVGNTLRNAWLLSIAALPCTVLLLLVPAAAFYISFVMNPAVVDLFVYLWAVCGFGVVAYLQSFLLRRAFRKLSPEAGQVKTVRTEGAVFTDEEHRTDDLMVQESSYSDPNWNRREEPVTAKKGKKRK